MPNSRQAKYLPLDPQRAEIRMFALSGSYRSPSVKGKLIIADLDDLDTAPFAFYEALSYTWGDANDTVSCKINGYEHQITRNLNAALISLRGRTRPRWMWVDALCINQDDLTERASQVQLMRRIFSQAVQVLVWLGPPGIDGAEALEMLDRITDFDTPDDFVEYSLRQSKYSAQWEAVARFFDRPWFRRVWIRQEVACAKEILLVCGRKNNLKIKWPLLVQVCEDIFPHMADFSPFLRKASKRDSGLLSVITLDSMHQTIERGDNIDLETLIFHGRGTEATDPKDRVYGVLGLAGDQAKGMNISYSLTPEEVFKNATIHLIEQTQRLDSLSGCQWSSSNSTSPSWVINPNLDFQEMVLRNREGTENLYSVAGNTNAVFAFENSQTELIVDGLVLDNIVDIGLNYSDTGTPQFATAFAEWLELLVRSNKRRSFQLSDSEMLVAFCRTVIANQDINGARADPAYIEDFYISTHTSIVDFASAFADRYEGEVTPFAERVQDVSVGRRMVGTSTGYFGLAGQHCAMGDLVCILFGAGVPFILRPTGSHFILIGEAYIDGIMDGQAFDEFQTNNSKTSTFRIV